jgi:hypothetical protein
VFFLPGFTDNKLNGGSEMSQHDADRDRKKEDDRPVTGSPKEHGEIPRTRDSSKDHKEDPYKDK